MSTPDQSNQFVQIHYDTRSSENLAAAISGGVLWAHKRTVRYLRSFGITSIDERSGQEIVAIFQIEAQGGTGNLQNAVIMAALRSLMPTIERWEWSSELAGLSTLVGKPRDVSLLIEKSVGEVQGVSKSRKAELAAVVNRLRHFPGDYCIAAVGNIVGKNDDNKSSLELDGLIVGYDRLRRRLVVCIIEAKTSKGGSESASVKHIQRVRSEYFSGKPWRNGQIVSKKEKGHSSAWIYSSITF
jgi:hypothetical protein